MWPRTHSPRRPLERVDRGGRREALTSCRAKVRVGRPRQRLEGPKNRIHQVVNHYLALFNSYPSLPHILYIYYIIYCILLLQSCLRAKKGTLLGLDHGEVTEVSF